MGSLPVCQSVASTTICLGQCHSNLRFSACHIEEIENGLFCLPQLQLLKQLHIERVPHNCQMETTESELVSTNGIGCKKRLPTWVVFFFDSASAQWKIDHLFVSALTFLVGLVHSQVLTLPWDASYRPFLFVFVRSIESSTTLRVSVLILFSLVWD